MRSHRSSSASRLQHHSTTLRWRRALCFMSICCPLILPNAFCAICHASELTAQTARDTLAPAPLAVGWVKRFFRHSSASSIYGLSYRGVSESKVQRVNNRLLATQALDPNGNYPDNLQVTIIAFLFLASASV